MEAEGPETGRWLRSAFRVTEELRSIRLGLHADWALLWGPVPFSRNAPFVCVLHEDREKDCLSALGIAVPLHGNPWAEAVLDKGAIVAEDAVNDPRLWLHRKLLSRSNIRQVVTATSSHDGVYWGALELYARKEFSQQNEALLGVVRAGAERIGTILREAPARTPRGLAPALAEQDPVTSAALHDLRSALTVQSLLLSSFERELRNASHTGEGLQPRRLELLLESLDVLRNSVTHASELTRVMALNTASPAVFSADSVVPTSTPRVTLPELLQLSTALVAGDLRERFSIECVSEAIEQAQTVREAASILRILVQLVQNAAQAVHGTPDGKVYLRLKFDGDFALVEIEDEGPGVAPEVLSRLFQAGVTTREPPEGHGYGLHTARKIAESLGATLTLYSVPGGGARFTLRIPRNRAGLAKRPEPTT